MHTNPFAELKGKTREYRMQPVFAQLGPDFMEPVKVRYDPGYNPAPYYPVTFAIKYDDETEPRSLFTADKGKPWNHTKASLLLSDDGLPIYGARRMMRDKETDTIRDATVYSFAMYDPTHPMFKPTVMKAVDYAMNLETEVTIEAMLAFDDALFPIYKTEKTSGTFAMSLASLYHDIITDMQDYPADFLAELAKNDRSIRKCKEDRDGFDGYHICVSSPNGDCGEIDLDEDGLKELYRHLVSFRLISHKEIVHEKSLDNENLTNNMHRIVPATFVSMWNDGEYRVETACKVDLDTKEVFDIETNENDPNIEAYNELDEEFIQFDGNDEEYEVQRKTEADDDYDGFWYD